ncbi:MAG: M17 family peptidase N-terminal domain-containing protein [Vampirovibrionales bacterium]|nr:M17 family peptidase N-terminal domain-containing protein [Vampirovibrionales bacterium]
MGSPNLTFKSVASFDLTTLKADVLICPVVALPEPKTEATAAASVTATKATGKKKSIDKGSDKAGDKALALSGTLGSLDSALGGFLQQAVKAESFSGAKGATLCLHVPKSSPLGVKKIVLVGTGSPDTEAHSVRVLKKSLAKGLTAALGADWIKQAAVWMNPELALSGLLRAVVQGVYCATYQSLEAKPDAASKLETVTILGKADAAQLKRLQIEAQAKSFAKDWVNHPSNLKTTDTMVRAAQSLKAYKTLSVSVESNPDWIAKNMPCFFTVAIGSLASDPPKWIKVTYKPSKTAKIKRHLAFVGKTVVFDTGGYQVKPDSYMCTMKGDMTGGAMTLGLMQALGAMAEAGLIKDDSTMVTAYLAATPNKIDSHAMLPDSIVETTCGKKVEIRHTDAEGRLTLIDAVAMAAKAQDSTPEPDVIVTTATLTGSAMRAVGECVAVMANEPAVKGGWRSKIESAAATAGDPAQSLDVWADDFEDIKSKLDGADILNTSQNKNRGAQSAAAFVMSGAPKSLPVVHLDIAGADMTGDEKATGHGQELLIEFALAEML